MILRMSGLGKPDLKSRAQGDEARDRREWNTAAERYQTYLSTNPEDADIWVQLGHAFKESGKREKAQMAYYRALSIAPDVPDTLLQIGHLEKVRGRLDTAFSWFQRALDIDPNFEPALAEFREREISPGSLGGLNPTGSADQESPLVQQVAALRDRLDRLDDFATAVRAIGMELQKLRKQSDSMSKRLDALESEGGALKDELARKLDDMDQRIAGFEDTPTHTRQPIAALLAHFQNVSSLDIEVRQQRAAIEELQRKSGL